MGELVRFPMELAGVPRKHSQQWSEPRQLIPQVFRTSWPATCGDEDCSHKPHLVIRAQAKVPCRECHQLLREGERFHVTAATNGFVVEQVHAECPERSC